MSKSIGIWGAAALCVSIAFLGCATRDVPARYPGTSAASRDGKSAPAADVTQSIRTPHGDAPESAAEAPKHDGQHGHHHH